MNTCNLSGRLSKPGTVRGSDPKVLSFVLETKYGGNETEKKERTTFVRS